MHQRAQEKSHTKCQELTKVFHSRLPLRQLSVNLSRILWFQPYQRAYPIMPVHYEVQKLYGQGSFSSLACRILLKSKHYQGIKDSKFYTVLVSEFGDPKKVFRILLYKEMDWSNSYSILMVSLAPFKLQLKVIIITWDCRSLSQLDIRSKIFE